MWQVGITGNMGSGKSTVCRIFNFLGIPIYDADTEARKLMASDDVLMVQIKALLGPSSYRTDGSLNTEYLAGQVFQDARLLKELNALVHPAVARHARAWHQAQTAPYTLREAALLIESGSHKQLDKLIVVSAPEQLRIERVKSRNGWSDDEILARMAKQFPESEKLKLADFIILNDGSCSLIKQVLDIHWQLFIAA
jgi:dephospho-CoA kinase